MASCLAARISLLRAAIGEVFDYNAEAGLEDLVYAWLGKG